MRHLDEWLPVSEIEGMRLFEKDLSPNKSPKKDLNLLKLFL
jgi:hypothetical protein